MKKQFHVSAMLVGLCLSFTTNGASAADQFAPELNCVHFLTHYVELGSMVRFEDSAGSHKSSWENSATDADGSVFVTVQSQGPSKTLVVMTKDGLYSVPAGNNWITDPFKEKNAKISPKWMNLLVGTEADVARTFGTELPDGRKVEVDLEVSSYKPRGLSGPSPWKARDSYDSYRSTIFGPEIVKSFQKTKYVDDLVILDKARPATTPESKGVIYAGIKLALKNFSKHYFEKWTLKSGANHSMDLTSQTIDMGSKACTGVSDPDTRRLAQETLAKIRADVLKQPSAPATKNSSAGSIK